MSKFFPKYQSHEIYPGVKSKIYDIGDKNRTQIIISRIEPNATVPAHKHNEIQFGMVLDGFMEIDITGERRLLKALRDGYVVPHNTTHAAANKSDRFITTMDFKTNAPWRRIKSNFLDLTSQRVIKTGITFQFFVTPWFEIMLSTIPKGGTMPTHKHENVQFGIAVDGEYLMSVGSEERNFSQGEVYYAPENEIHAGFNPHDKVALSLNIFMPPRYNKLRSERVNKLVEVQEK
jgi:bacilysin biosynthesis protein BacB